MDKKNNETHDSLSKQAILRALFENYESIYAVDAETSSFQCFHESDSYSSLKLDDRGDDFFKSLESDVIKSIYEKDRQFVQMKLSKDAISEGLKKERFYSFVYRLMIDGKPLYHKLRATMEDVGGRPHYLIGIRNVDQAFRQDRELVKKISSMHGKEITHLEAILAGAEGYLEANLTKDIITEFSPYKNSVVLPLEFHKKAKLGTLAYSEFMKWHIENMLVLNKEPFTKISDRHYLIDCFNKEERRASASFSMKTVDDQIQPCKIVFYLYKDASSGDILSFCVLYDLTEQQRKEKELKDLENELQRIRLRNFTSQMQPHFLYNALGSIQEIILDDPKYASELIGDFTIHLRSCIRAMANDDQIPFSQELENIRAYINIEKMRLGNKLSVFFDIRAQDFSILPLSVQPIVENAIRHGIYGRGEKGGEVSVITEKNEGTVIITVKDNGVGFDVEEYEKEMSDGTKDSTGLKNIVFRLNKMMNATVNIQSVRGVGTSVTITIPKESEQ